MDDDRRRITGMVVAEPHGAIRLLKLRQGWTGTAQGDPLVHQNGCVDEERSRAQLDRLTIGAPVDRLLNRA